MRELYTWLSNWRHHLAEIVIVAGTAGSALTTFMGARKLVSESLIVAGLLTFFFQGGLFVVAHAATDGTKPNHRPRTLALLLTWLMLAFFSVYSSAIGAFELVKDSLKNDHSRAGVVSQWQDAQGQISEFKTKALTWLTQDKQDVEIRLNAERERKRAADRTNRRFSTSRLQALSVRLDALNDAEAKIREVKLGGTPPPKTEDAVAALDAAFDSAKSAYTSLPEEGRAQCAEPRRALAGEPPDDLQKAFWAEVRAGSPPALEALLIAALLDSLPALLRYAGRSRRTLAEKIRGARRSLRDVWDSLVSPLTPAAGAIRVAVTGYPDLDITLNFAGGYRHVTLAEMRPDLAVVESEVARNAGRRVRLRSAMNTSRMELVPDFPLLDQLDPDLTLHLDFEDDTTEV